MTKFVPEDVQNPHITRINPDAVRVGQGAYKSYQFIARFTAKDTSPITVSDAASQAARDAQVVKMTRGILGEAVQHATDDQVLQLWRDYMAGRY